MVSYLYTKELVSVDRLEQEIQQSAITVSLCHCTVFGDQLTIFFKIALSVDELLLLNTIVEVHTGEPLPQNNVLEITGSVTSTGEITLSWAQLKIFYDTYKAVCQINYVDMSAYYFIWVNFRGQEIYCPELLKADAGVFEASYKAYCNILENERSRITTCKQGRKYHSRYISFDTATDTDQFDNTDYLDQDFGDVTYTMRDINGAITTDKTLCKETHLDFEPHFDFELSGGTIDIPTSFAGNDDDAWELHVLAVPDIPAASGGCIVFIANPHLKWYKGKSLGVDASLNPSDMKYSATYHTGKIRVIIKHPLGALSNFQANFKLFK